MNRKKEGVTGEQTVCEYISAQGMRVMQRNFSCRGGEIDIVARDKGTLVFIEVKSRESEAFGFGAEAVTRTKRRRIVQAAKLFLLIHKAPEMDVRFDVAVVTRGEVEYIKDAFTTADL